MPDKKTLTLYIYTCCKPKELILFSPMQKNKTRNRFSSTLMDLFFLWSPNSMMAASRDLPFPLAIMCLVLIRGYSPLPTTSGAPGMSPMRPLKPRGFSTDVSFEDYSQYEELVNTILPETVPPNGGTLTRCDYNPCLESQIPCAASTSCLCPGFTPQNEAPEAPILRSVSWNGSEVVIWWCAPYSYVTAYIVTIGGQDSQKFGKDQRRGGVGNIDHISEVCVVAVNDAGRSDGSCQMYQYRDSSLPLKAGLIGGALGFLLLLLLVVLLWRHKRQRKQQASISMHDTAETQWTENRAARPDAQRDNTLSHETLQPSLLLINWDYIITSEFFCTKMLSGNARGHRVHRASWTY